MSELNIVSRLVEEMASSSYMGLKDPYGVVALTAKKRSAFLHNPFVKDKSSHCQMIGIKDGVAIGGEIHFPLCWSVSGEVHPVMCGSTTFVAKEFRKTELGLKFPEEKMRLFHPSITCGAGCSQMMVKVLRYLKEPVFTLPRLIMLFRSRSVVERKIRGFIAVFLSLLIDCCLKLYWLWFRICCNLMLRRYTFETVGVNDTKSLQEVFKLIASDSHCFSELHDVRWLKWHLTESFTQDGPLSLTVVKKSGELVAFYMTKKRFHEQASSRGFKNVWIGSIMEWQVIPEEDKMLSWILLRAASLFNDSTDAVEIVTNEKRLYKFLRAKGWQHIGDSNFTFHIHDGPLKNDKRILDPKNWRLRPAMGDVGLT